jgi:hypothetical protein
MVHVNKQQKKFFFLNFWKIRIKNLQIKFFFFFLISNLFVI